MRREDAGCLGRPVLLPARSADSSPEDEAVIAISDLNPRPRIQPARSPVSRQKVDFLRVVRRLPVEDPANALETMRGLHESHLERGPDLRILRTRVQR